LPTLCAMKILSAEQVRQWDQFTIENKPILSIDLMETAAMACTEWIIQHYPDTPTFAIFCGKGNNGGDGLAIARMLMERNYQVTIFILEFGHKGTHDFQINLSRLHQLPNAGIHFIQSEEQFHEFDPGQIIIDAIIGSGLNRQLDGLTAKLVDYINSSACKKIAIDIPSGMFVDHSSKGNTMVKADHTLTFQSYKPAFLFSENADFIGMTHLLDIGLLPEFVETIDTRFEMPDAPSMEIIYKPRNRFAHKGDYGHALLVCGSHGKIGAAALTAKACLRSGTGLVTMHIPVCGYEIIQTAVPEAMVITDDNLSINTKVKYPENFTAIGIGPGLGTATETSMMLKDVMVNFKKPMVIDADALNIISTEKDLLKNIPENSILTPHPKEFERLFGETNNDFERAALAAGKAAELNIVIVLKGHHTIITTPCGKIYFNATGNAGMATAGSGDVLTGILTGLIAQGYESENAAKLGVYLHGLAGDIAANESSPEAIIAGDITENLGRAFRTISQ
jgi:ADP-dependent NAD(P)H-hydrate dehydratase / NAD(P)H-hydrate epimerase